LPICWCKPVKALQDRPVKQSFKSISTIPDVENGEQRTKAIPERDILTAFPTNGTCEEFDKERRKIGRAATLVMLQPSAPARKPTAWIHAPSQPLM
jgi:hypothetical protein